MATIASLNVLLGMNTRGFSKGAKRAKTDMDRLKGTAQAAMKVFGALGLALSAQQGFAILKREVRESMQLIDALAKRADRLRVSTQGLGALEFSAGLTGSSPETLGKALEKFNVELGKAQQGSGQAGKALAALGLNLDAVSRIPADRALAKIADRFRNLATPAEKAAIAQQLFGRSGVELINLLEQGSAGLSKQASRFAELGGSVSRLDAAKIEMANDAFLEMEVAARGLANSIAIELAPALKLWATGTAELLAGMPTLTETLELSGVKTASFTDDIIAQAAGMKGLGPVVRELRERYSEWADEQARAALAANEAAAAADAIRLAAERAEAANESYLESLQLQIDTFGMAAREAELFRRVQEGLSAEQQMQAQAMIDKLAELEAARDRAARAAADQAAAEAEAAKRGADAQRDAFDNFQRGLLDAARRQQRQRDDLLREGQSVRDANRTPAERLRAEVADLERLLAAGAIDRETFNRAARQAVASSAAASGPAERFTLGAPSALERGSREALSAVNAASRQNDPVLRELQEQRRERQKDRALDQERNRVLERIAAQGGNNLVGDIP